MQKIVNILAFKQVVWLFLLILSFFLSAFAENTVPDKTPIKIGMSASLTGGDSFSGQNMKLGIEVYFDKINAAGGIEGRKLQLMTLDDGYEPLRAADNLHKLIDQDHVLAIIGNNGTPETVVTVPIVNQSKILLYGARSGTALLRRTPPDRYVINFRTSYFNEVNALIKGILASGIKPDNIAFFTQNDLFGDSIYDSAMKSLKAQGYSDPELLPHGRYDRNSSDVIFALSRIVEQEKSPIKAFILGGVYQPNAQFIKLASTEYPNAIFLTVSGLINASDIPNNMDDKVIVSQVVPFIDSTLPAVVEYRDDLKKYGHGGLPNEGSLEGYLVAKSFVIALKKAASNHTLTREGIIDAMESMNKVDLGIGVTLNLNNKDHSGIDALWITAFKDGKLVQINWPKQKR